ncbi:peptidylprolyl isomerase [Nannocystaceae bacterium ST9]
MFGSNRGKSGDLVIWLILGVLALAFGLGFGLPSDQLSFGDSGLVKVHDENVGKEDFAYQTQAIARVLPLPEGERSAIMGVREEVLEAVIERLVLVDTANQLGLAAETRDAEQLTKAGYFVVLGSEVGLWPWVESGKFDYTAFKNMLPEFSVPEPRYLEIQRQEMLALQVRDLISASVVVPEPELWAAYEKDNNQLAIRYVRFPFEDYAELIDPTASEVDAWITEHPDELTESWERNQMQYVKLPAQVELRLIEVPKPIAPPADADEATKAEWQLRFDTAKASLVAARTRIVEGGESFPALARELSKHTDTARSGGYFGWTQVTDTGSGLDPAIDEAAQKLADGEVSEPIETDESFWLITVEGHREGDVPEADARRELAEEAVRRARGRELARQAAEEALLAVREGKSLNDLFGAAKPQLGGDPSLNPIEELPLGGEPGSTPGQPRVEETGLFTYGKAIPGIGSQSELADAAWAAEPDTMLDQSWEVPGGFVIAEVDDKQKATKEGFAAARAELYRQVGDLRANGVISGFTKHQCYLGKATVDIRVNEVSLSRLMNYGDLAPKDEQGRSTLKPYEVCSRVGDRGGLLRLSMMLGGGAGGGGAPPMP